MDMNAFFDELEKIAQPLGALTGAAPGVTKQVIEGAKVIGPKALKHWKIPALLGAGGAGTLLTHQALKDWELGRKLRQQHER